MEEKENMQQIVQAWKMLKSPAEKEVFIEKIKAEVAAKNGEELLAGMKALSEMVHDLHTEVFQQASPGREEQILVLPKSSEEADFLRVLLRRMDVSFQEMAEAA